MIGLNPVWNSGVVHRWLCAAAIALFGQFVSAQDSPAISEEKWPAGDFAKQVEYTTGVKFPFDSLCTPHLFTEPSFPIGCRFGPIDVYIEALELDGVRALPSLLMFETANAWITTSAETDLAARMFDWGYAPTKFWQAAGANSGAICGYRDSTVVLETDELPLARAATCFLGFPTSDGQEILVRIRFEALRELDSVFANNASYELPFLNYISFFVHSTYSLSGF